jgi:ABC-type lipoprotein export system ATPase subunit
MKVTAIAPAEAPAVAQSLPTATSPARLSVHALRLARGCRAIEIPDFALEAGKTLALVGPSGSGKTTALMALSLMHKPAEGMISIDGVEPWAFNRRARDHFRGQHIGLIFQSFHLVDALSVRSNIALAARCAGKPADPQRIDHLLTQLGLAEISDQRSDRISHGQAQRVAVARALVNRPSIILADEPTSALDDRNAETLLKLLKASAVTEQAALLITSHDRRVLDKVDLIVTLGGGA